MRQRLLFRNFFNEAMRMVDKRLFMAYNSHIMAQTVRLTITPDLENALQILHTSTMGTLNTTELIKMAIGELAQLKKMEMTPDEMDKVATHSFYEWAKEDGTLEVNNISPKAQLKPFVPEPYVSNR
jgi:hypothetical protein